MKVQAAAINWRMREVRKEEEYFNHLEDLVTSAHFSGAEIIVLPELHVLELLALYPGVDERDSPVVLSGYAAQVQDRLKALSESLNVILVGGSHFVEEADGVKNVCSIFVPGQEARFAEKNVLTGYERDVWQLKPGAGLVLAIEMLGVCVCYDCEFPEAVRALAEAGAKILAVPAWTETLHGFHRVRWSCLARAVENQMFVIHSSLVGGLGREPVPDSYGSSAIIAPSCERFPHEEILIEGAPYEEGIVLAALDLDALDECREGGEVANWNDRSKGQWIVRN